MVNVENACASASTAFRGVWLEIASGLYDVGLAVGVEPKISVAAHGNVVHMTVCLQLGEDALRGFPLLERHLVSERFQAFDQVTPESDWIQGVKIVTSQFVILQIVILQQVVKYIEQ